MYRQRYGGRIIDTAADGILAEFPSVINATECAVEIQIVMATCNEAVPGSRRMQFRIGIETEPAFGQFVEHTHGPSWQPERSAARHARGALRPGDS